MNYLKRIFAYLRPYQSLVFLGIICNVLTAVFSLLSVLMTQPFLNILFNTATPAAAAPAAVSLDKNSLSQLFNNYFGNFIAQSSKTEALGLICIAIIIAFFLKNLTRYLALYFLAPVRNGVVRDIRRHIYEKIMRLPLGYFTDTRKGDLLTRITSDAQEIEWSALSTLEVIFREPLMIILSLAAMLFISPTLTLSVLGALVVAAFLIGNIGRNLRKVSALAQERLSEVLSIVEESIGGLRIIKAFNAEATQSRKFNHINDQHAATMTRLFRRRDLSSPLSEFLGVCVFVAILYFGGKQVLAGNSMDAATFLTFLGIFFQVISPAKAFTGAYYNIQKGLASMNRIDAILQEPERISEAADAQSLQTFKQQVEFKNVSFSYGDKAVLHNISFTLPKGKVVALVGQSGAGKSTIADLLPRFYEVPEGEILIDGIDIKKLKIKDLRALMGVVSQEAILFNDSIANNIVFGKEAENVAHEAVAEAAKIANAAEFIELLEQNYDANIGERGSKLSGGQRQRLTIARAVLKNPPILILDEATSALDTESEKLVQAALHQLMQERTVLVIAHRLSTIQAADEILVMKQGSIIERGKHEELLARGGEYSRLVAMQGF
ncbi:MAG: ABC transporter ATP-binding protein [Sphingobacteriales bacterium]|nr:ABC transporter ATP-binding protein [Sphingobacteriales bacterium]